MKPFLLIERNNKKIIYIRTTEIKHKKFYINFENFSELEIKAKLEN